MKRYWITALVIVVAAVVGAVTLAGQPDPRPAIPACAYEDGSTQETCYWDAAERGNGEGQSFVSYDYGSRIRYTGN